MFISSPVPMEEYGPHFNEPLFLPPELSEILKVIDGQFFTLTIHHFYFFLF